VNGREIARGIIEELKKLPRPGKKLAAVLVGENEAARVFLQEKEKIARELGISFALVVLDENVSQDELARVVEQFSIDGTVGGIIIQLPLPPGINQAAVIEKLAVLKDIDNLTGRAPVAAPAVLVVQAILDWLPDRSEFKKFKSLKSLRVVVVGSKGFLVGRPVCRWLDKKRKERAKLEIRAVDVETKNLKPVLADADLVISGVGQAGLINPVWLKRGAGVIDFGYPPDFGSWKLEVGGWKPAFYTPTPGGTGPILVAGLWKNFFLLNNRFVL